MSRKYKDPMSGGQEVGPAVDSSPFNKSAPLRVSFVVYIISIVVVALVIFIVMLVMYFPGYQKSAKIKLAVKNSDVFLRVKIPNSELGNRKENPFTKQYKKNLADVFKSMGAKSETVEIVPSGQ